MRVFYLIGQALYGLKRRWSFNLILMVCIASSFLVFDTFLLITQNLKSVEQKLKGEVQIEVYLNDDITTLQLHLLLQSLKGFPEVEKVEYRSKQEAWTQLENYLGKDLLEGLDSNPLPASFLLGLKREHTGFEQVAEVASKIKSKEGVEDVEFGGTWLKKLDQVIFISFVVDIIFGIFIAIAVVMIVSNFMRVVVLSQAESIHIMSLMGASKGYISFPLLVQGLLLGGAAAWVGVLFLWVGYLLFASQILAIAFLPFYMIPALIGWGMILGALGSFFSIRGHLES
ncbi:MAG: hypothetical protein AMJ91_02875 [candidate division Zixibacteria bacterium SM23_73_3]|nr:MAG: hypothetical protein AMJ91_02875 [candidate division Zixibacteria bacterium SM23_73_3]